MRPFLRFIRERLITFLLNILLIGGLVIAIHFDLWEIYVSILLLLLGGLLLFKGVIYLNNKREDIDERLMFIILGSHKETLIEKILVKHHYLLSKPAYHILRQHKFHELTQIPIRYLPLALKIIQDNKNLRSSMTPSAQLLVEHCFQRKYNPNSLFKILSYYRLTPRELAQIYIKHHFLAPAAKERLIYEAGYEERQLLENNLALNSPLLLEIEEKHQIDLDSNYSLLL